MSPATTATSVRRSNPLLGIVWGGLVCGTLDITAAIVVYGRFGARPIPLLQGIAAGVLGPRAHDGGLATAFLGLFAISLSLLALLPSTLRRAVGFGS